jgi:hypothetical protein
VRGLRLGSAITAYDLLQELCVAEERGLLSCGDERWGIHFVSFVSLPSTPLPKRMTPRRRSMRPPR